MEKNKLQIYYDIFKEALKNVQRTIRSAKSKYFVELIEKNANNPRMLFSIINIVVNPPILNLNPSLAICENFLNSFKTKIENLRGMIPQMSCDFLGRVIPLHFSSCVKL